MSRSVLVFASAAAIVLFITIMWSAWGPEKSSCRSCGG